MNSIIEKYMNKEVIQFPTKVNLKPKLSISVLTYQHKDYIKRCLEGILMQKTDFAFEILLGEDNSSDGTREICIEYAEAFPERIRLFLHHRENNISINGAPTGRFNFLYNFYSARGEYFALCEGDDYWTDPLKLQKQIDFLEKNEGYILSFHDVNIENTRKNKIKNYKMIGALEKETLDTEDLLKPWFIPTCSIVFKKTKEFSLPNWFAHSASGDIALILLLSLGGKFKYFNEVMGVYRKHDDGISVSHTGYSKVYSMIHLYQNFNEYTNKEYETKLQQAMKSEIHGHLPEFHELRRLRKSKKIKVMNVLQALMLKIKGRFNKS